MIPLCSLDLEQSTMLTNKANDESRQETKMKMQEETLHYDYLEMIEVPQQCREKHSNFSIDYILGNGDNKESQFDGARVHYDWLNYTRYRPPKLQRIRRKESVQKRRLGRNPRIPFSSEQVNTLEEKFQMSPYLSNADVNDLSKSLHLSESRIKIWFQNRRARERRDSHDTSRKGVNLIKSFLMKTRPSGVIPESVQDLSVSAFRPCQNILR